MTTASPTAPTAPTTASAEQVALLAARPRYGYLTHAVRDQQRWRARMGLGRLIMYARPLCQGETGRRYSHGPYMITGGHESPTPVLDAFSSASRPCLACQRKVEALAADGLLAPVPNASDITVDATPRTIARAKVKAAA